MDQDAHGHHLGCTAGAFDRRRLLGALGIAGAGLTLPFGREL